MENNGTEKIGLVTPTPERESIAQYWTPWCGGCISISATDANGTLASVIIAPVEVAGGIIALTDNRSDQGSDTYYT